MSATSFTSLDNADRWMMANSDNRTTFASEQGYGRAAINAHDGSLLPTQTVRRRFFDTLIQG